MTALPLNLPRGGFYCACKGKLVGWAYAERCCAQCQANWCPNDQQAADQRTVAERKWQAGTVAAKPQKPMDIGLFSDSHLQLDLLAKAARKDRSW